MNNCGHLLRHKRRYISCSLYRPWIKKYADVCIFLVNERRRLVSLSDVAFLVPVVTKKIKISQSSSETGAKQDAVLSSYLPREWIAKDRPPSYGGLSNHAKFITQLYISLDVHDVFAAFSCRIKVSSLKLQS